MEVSPTSLIYHSRPTMVRRDHNEYDGHGTSLIHGSHGLKEDFEWQ